MKSGGIWGEKANFNKILSYTLPTQKILTTLNKSGNTNT